MADVFISYASSDRAVAERIARGIEAAGLSVWWDRHIKGGAEFSRDIEKQLDSARRVLVLWSKEAVNSRWVRDEATVAADSQRLVAATIDGTPAPLGFRQFQTLNLQRSSKRSGALPAELLDVLGGSRPDSDAARAKHRRPLAWRMPAAVLVVLAALAALWMIRPGPLERWLPRQQQSERVALAVMPFSTAGGPSDKAYLGPGLASALAGNLADLSGIRIAASTSTQAVARRSLTAPAIARELGVTHLVEGDIQQEGDHYSITARLIDARSSEQLWARGFDGPVNQLQSLQARVTRELASVLRTRLGVGQGDIAERSNVDPLAYQAYLRALERVSVRDQRDSRLEAIKQFRLAATIQPDFADAHAGHAYLLALTVPQQLAMSWRQLAAEQRRVTDRALQLDPDNDLALIARSTALKNFSGDATAALSLDRAVLRRSPNFGPAHYSMASSLWMLGRPRDALGHIDQAIDRDPFDVILRFYRAKILYSLGDYQAVRDAAQKCPPPCAGTGFFWFLAMGGFGTAADWRDDQPLITQRARAEGIPEKVILEGDRVIDALMNGRQLALSPAESDQGVQFLDAAIEARLVGFTDGLRLARTAADTQQTDNVLDILNEGRVTFTPEQRADPRYHALFRHPRLVRVERARRKSGLVAGLPVFPVKPYTGR